MVKKRDTMMVSPKFNSKMKELQKKLELSEGREISIRELTDRIAKTNGIEEFEKKLVENSNTIDLKFRIDRRFLG